MTAAAQSWFDARPAYTLEWLEGTVLQVARDGTWVGSFQGKSRAESLEMAQNHCENREADEA